MEKYTTLRAALCAGLWFLVLTAAAIIALTMSQSEDLTVPSIPASQEDSPLVNLWRQAIRKQTVDTRSDPPAVRTYLAPTYVEVINWVPQDSAHPLYVPKYQPLLQKILRDYMVSEEVKPDDPRLSEATGLTVTNLNGGSLTFKKTDAGITVNDVPVEKSKANSDGTSSYVLAESLFGHREEVNKAWEANNRDNPPSFGPFGGPHPPPPPPPTK